ncbi:MAG: OmpA family protein [Bacteroidota bacterium]
MKKQITYRNLLLAAALTVSAGWASIFAQTPNGTQIKNTAAAYVTHPNGQKDTVKSNIVSTTVAIPGKLTLSKTASPGNALIGNTVLYKLIVGNAGYSTLSTVRVIDSLSSNLQFVSATHGTFTNGVLTWPIDSITAINYDTVVVTAIVSRSVSNNTVIWNKAYATELSGQKVMDSVRIVAQSLSVTKNAPLSAFTKDTISYTIQITDSCSSSLSGMVLVDTLNTALTFVSATNGGTYDPAARRVLWNILKLDSLSMTQYKIAVVINDTTISSYALVNQAWLSGSGINAVNAKAQTAVQRSNPLLLLTKKAQDTVATGKVFIYTIAATNTGNVRLRSVKVLDTLHTSYFIPQSAVNATLKDSIISWSKDTMSVGESDTIKVSVQLRTDAPVLPSFTNTVYATTQQTGFTVFSASKSIIPIYGFIPIPSMSIKKSVSADTVVTGATVTYSIRLQNTGNVTLTKVTASDTLASLLTPMNVSASSSASVSMNGKIVLYTRDSLAVNQSDTIKITAQLSRTASDTLHIINVAHASANLIQGLSDTANIRTKVIVPSKSCRIYLNISPYYVIGNGKNAAKIQALAVDTLGNPKPDGTPLFFKTTAGYFSNGKTSIVIPTTNGYAVDSLRDLITSSSIVYAKATITANDSNVCAASDSAIITFYPGAIIGYVIDNRTGVPVDSALVQVYSSSGTLIGSVLTSTDGSYFVPIPVTDTYTIKITVVDKFGKTIVTTSTVTVTVPGVGGVPPVTNINSVTGKVFFDIPDKPVDAYRVKVLLIRLSTSNSVSQNSFSQKANASAATITTIIDSTKTDSTGTYVFLGIAPGKYEVVTSDSLLEGSVNITDTLTGQYVINANIPILLDRSITLLKTGLPTILKGDTGSYTITLKNSGKSSTTNSVLVDSLDSAMRFLAAGSALDAAPVYDSTSRKIKWSIGTLDSLAGSRHFASTWVRVRFADTISTDRVLKNNTFFTSDMTDRIDTSALTSVSVPVLQVTKTASKSSVEVGDVIVYTVTATNNSQSTILRNVKIMDRIPLGFKYLAGSTYLGSTKISDPVSGKVLVWSFVDTLSIQNSISLTYRLVAGAGALVSNGINTASATAVLPNSSVLQSNTASVQVSVKQGIFTDHGLIIGKVFFDRNRNAYQDEGEEGVKGIELVLEDGTRVTTGDDGKYSMPDVYPGDHVIRVRKSTLPKGATLLAGYDAFAGDPVSRFVYVTPSGVARADFYLAQEMPDTVFLHQSLAKTGRIEIQRIAEPRNVVFIEDEKLAPMKLSGLNFDVAKATLRQEAMPTLKQLAEILIEYPDISITIVGHTDSSPMHTREFKDNTALSIGRANSVKKYLLTQEHIDSARVKTLGYGETKPIAPNTTKDGKQINRRVEFYFDNRIEQPQRVSTSILFKIPIRYEGTSGISKLEWTDLLDSQMSFEEGSATLGDSSIAPRVAGNTLHWTLEGLGKNFHQDLLYRVTVKKPAGKILKLSSFSTLFHCSVHDSIMTISDTLLTHNEVAVAVKGRAVNYILSGVLFDVAKATLRRTALTALNTSAEALNQDPTATVLVEGHTDSTPIHTEEFPSNIELSEARANTVVEKLTSNFRIAGSRLRSIGFGEHRPITTNATSDGRQLNRRVEVRIVSKSFIENVIPDGFIDSSSVAYSLVDPVQREFSTSEEGHQGDQFIVRLSVERNANTETAETIIVDSLSPGVHIVENSIKAEEGIDTVSIGKVLTARCSAAALQSSLSFRIEIDGPIDTREIFQNRFSIVRHEKNGDIMIDRAQPVIVQVTAVKNK